MNLQFYLEKLYASDEFKQFKKENPDTYLCSAFFVIDLEEKNPDNKQHFDYYLPKTKEMFSFQLEEGVKKVPVKMLGEKIPEKILVNYDFDFDEIEKIISAKMKEEGIKNTIQRILLSLQTKNKKDFLVGTVFISALGLLKVHINISEMKITLFEKKSFFDMIKIIKKKE
jgi:hypothetical protein